MTWSVVRATRLRASLAVPWLSDVHVIDIEGKVDLRPEAVGAVDNVMEKDAELRSSSSRARSNPPNCHHRSGVNAGDSNGAWHFCKLATITATARDCIRAWPQHP